MLQKVDAMNVFCSDFHKYDPVPDRWTNGHLAIGRDQTDCCFVAHCKCNKAEGFFFLFGVSAASEVSTCLLLYTCLVLHM